MVALEVVYRAMQEDVLQYRWLIVYKHNLSNWVDIGQSVCVGTAPYARPTCGLKVACNWRLIMSSFDYVIVSYCVITVSKAQIDKELAFS